MIYQTLYQKFKKQDKVVAGIIGAGHYGKAVITQSMYNKYLTIPIIADKDLKAARFAYEKCGISDGDIVCCETESQAKKALEAGKYVITEDPMIMMGLPLDIIAESTGIPDAGAKYCEAILKNGKHLALINKETDSVVGPYIKQMADSAGLICTPVDGDQHGLMMGLYSWAKSLGLDIISAGKMRDAEYIYDRNKRHMLCLRDGDYEGEQFLSEEDLKYFDELPDGRISEYITERKKRLPNLPHTRGFDICENVVAANALGLIPDVPGLHLPIVRTREMPRVLCSVDDGGILGGNGRIDSITQMRTSEEANLGGGVYIIATSKNEYSRYILNSKGLMHNTSGSASLIYRPHHLCGVETATSLLTAVLMGLPTGYEDYSQRYDMVKVAARDLKKGETVSDDYSFDYVSIVIPAVKVEKSNPIPAHMAFGNKLLKDVPAGTTLTFDMVEEPEGSVLWRLRREQEKSSVFGK